MLDRGQDSSDLKVVYLLKNIDMLFINKTPVLEELVSHNNSKEFT